MKTKKPKKINSDTEKVVLDEHWKKYAKDKDPCNIIPAQLFTDAYYIGFMRGREVEKGLTDGIMIEGG
jgi:hypothetical protein